MTLALRDAGLFEWEEFRRLLIEEIGAFDAGGAAAGTFRYYARWEAAFERLLAAKGLCTPAELEARARALAARPAGHDHPHGHPHVHPHEHPHDREG